MSYNDSESGTIVLDIETCADPDAASFLDPIKAPANYKDAAKIDAYKQEKLIEVVGKAGLEPDLCDVVAVGWQVDGGAIDFITRADEDEPAMLAQLWRAIGSRRIIGFNVLSFDLPVLIRRSQLLGVAHGTPNLDRYRTPHCDLLARLSFNGALTYRSLAFYCRRFGIPCEDTTKGADIQQLVLENAWGEIAAHVKADVEKTAALAQKLGWLRVAEVASTF